MLFQNDITSSFFVWLFISLQLLTSIGYHVVTIDYRGTVLFWYFTLWFDKLSVTIQYKCRFTCIWMYENFKPLDWRIFKEVISLNSWLFSWEGTLETHLLEKQPLMENFFLNNLWKILRMSTFKLIFMLIYLYQILSMYQLSIFPPNLMLHYCFVDASFLCGLYI